MPLMLMRVHVSSMISLMQRAVTSRLKMILTGSQQERCARLQIKADVDHAGHGQPPPLRRVFKPSRTMMVNHALECLSSKQSIAPQALVLEVDG